jgi:hypothetical protein
MTPVELGRRLPRRGQSAPFTAEEVVCRASLEDAMCSNMIGVADSATAGKKIQKARRAAQVKAAIGERGPLASGFVAQAEPRAQANVPRVLRTC